MKTRILSAAFTFATLAAIAGPAVAGPHDGYNDAFYGKADTASEMAGKAAFGTPSPSGNAWSGHEAYQRTLAGSPLPTLARTPTEVMGKAAYGTMSGRDAISSGPDGNAIYRRAFGNSD